MSFDDFLSSYNFENSDFSYKKNIKMSGSDPMGSSAKSSSARDVDYEAEANQMRESMGTAKALSKDAFSRQERKVFAVFAKAGASDTEKVRRALAFYHMTQGTSDATQWSGAPPVVVSGVSVPPNDYVRLITTGSDKRTLRQFMTQFAGAEAVKLADTSVGSELLQERAMRSGLGPADVHLALDFAPLTDYATGLHRLTAKTNAIAAKERGTGNYMSRAAGTAAEERVHLVGSSTPRQYGTDSVL